MAPDAMTAYSDPNNIPIAHSPDGRLIAAVYDDSTAVAEIPRANEIKIWGLSSRRQLGPALTGTKENILLTTFTTDGSVLVSLDENGVFRSYTVSPSQLVRQLCTMSGGLTEEEWKTYIPTVPYRKTC